MEKKELVILGCGNIAQRFLKKITRKNNLKKIILCGRNSEKLTTVKNALPSHSTPVICHTLDVTDVPAVEELIRGSDLVVNFTRPYELTALPAIKAAIAAQVHLLDCGGGDIVSTNELLACHHEAQAAGSTILIHLGNVPGMMNILVSSAARELDQIDEIHMAYVSNESAYVPKEYMPAFIEYVCTHPYTSPAVAFNAGKFVEVLSCSEKSIVRFPDSAEAFEVMTASHPEVITLPRAFPQVKTVTFKSTYGEKFNALLKLITDLQLNRKGIVEINNQQIARVDIATAVAKLKTPEISDAQTKKPSLLRGWQSTVSGYKNAKPTNLSYWCQDSQDKLIESVLLIGAEMLLENRIEKKGIVTPEELNPKPFIECAVKNGAVIWEDRQTIVQ